MTKKFYLFLALLVLSTTISQAQTHDKCAADNIHKAAIEKDPTILLKIQDAETKISEFKQNRTASNKKGTVYTIPVVIHIVHNGEAVGTGTNISDAQAISQITRLNEDFRKTNEDSLDSSHPFYDDQADCEIEFCLASTDPDGNATTGIIRHNGQRESWDEHDLDSIIKPSTIWDRYSYMNMWCVEIDDPNSPGLDGYGTFPTSTTDSTDGVVVKYDEFGSFDNYKSIVATHEVGHYLNLNHIWGDNEPNCGDDLVDDTPPAYQSNSGCPTFPHNANDSCGTDANGEMFMNYMDYSDASCTVMFTYGQKDRMQAALTTLRSSLLTSEGCNVPVGISNKELENRFDVYPNPSNGNFTINGRLVNASNSSITLLGALGNVIQESKVSSLPFEINVNDLPNGVYFIHLNNGSNTLTKKVFITK